MSSSMIRCILLISSLMATVHLVVAAVPFTIVDISSSSAVGDPGMKRDGLRVAFEAWNFCNEVGTEAPLMGSPRAADCFDISSGEEGYHLSHKVTEHDNKLGVGDSFKGLNPKALHDPDLYAAEKEIYLGNLCQVTKHKNNTTPWQFWMIMLKNGNYDTTSGLCPENGKPAPPFAPGRFPCFGNGCMNQPILVHQPTSITGTDSSPVMVGGFNGTYDDISSSSSAGGNISYYEVTWQKKVGVGSWEFKHRLRTSKNYPWLMLYLRADATKGFSGGYHYDTRGMLKITAAWCAPSALANCPPYHITPNDTKIYRNDTARFPYGAYHYYCAPGNAQHLEKPYSTCDPYSNPQAQELVQLLPHPIWAEYGYPTKQGDGWEGDARTWELDVGGLSSRLYFYQDPGTKPAKRIWTSLDTGTEIFVSDKDEEADWTVSDFDVIIT
ncbi:hypothetical protein CTI12_AA154490 [Artemisia annua]|uniref:DUF7705 domain-containing protein n=1 Tax=Artemisia annua TaxID=35608 RepID=A0A2U1PGU6_ARTAN|nr:hypothetical protein CTI12_AA154490 [Artemisia annua]